MSTSRIRPLLLPVLALLVLAVVLVYGVASAANAGEMRFIVVLMTATAVVLACLGRRPWFALLASASIYGMMWASSALKFQFLEVPAIAPDLYYFFTVDTLHVIAGYPGLAASCLALVIGLPLLTWLAWRSDTPLAFDPRPRYARGWRWGGLAAGMAVLVLALTPRGPFADLYGKPMWIAVNDKSFITDFIISFYDTQIHLPPPVAKPDPTITWRELPPTNAQDVPVVRAAGGSDVPVGHVPSVHPDVIAVLEESTFDPTILTVCKGNPLCKRGLTQPDRRTLAHGLLGVHTFGGGTWTSEFALITGLAHTLFGNAGLYAPYNLSPLAQHTLARSFKQAGYRVVALYPTNADFINGRNAYREYGFDKLYDGVELGLAWHSPDPEVFALFWKLYQQEKADHPDQPILFFLLTIHQHGPHMDDYKDLKPPFNRPLYPGKLSDRKGLDDWLNLNLSNYLDRGRDSDNAMAALEKQLFERDVPTVLLHFGDHQPSFDGAMHSLDKVLPPDWGENRHWATYYMLKSNQPDAPKFDLPIADIVYLGGMLQQAAGVPLDEYYTANRLLRERCHGRYEECADKRLVPSYHDFIFREIKDLGDGVD